MASDGILVDMAGRLQAQGATSIVLWVVVGNPAVRFYEHMGGVATKTETQSFGPVVVDAVQYRWSDINVLAARKRTS